MIPGDDKIRLMERMLNVFENDSGSPETDYGALYLYHDGNGGRKQVTLGRGFTQDGGNLGKVVERYVAKGGPRWKMLDIWKEKKNSTSLSSDQGFLLRLRDAAVDPQMREAQDEVFREVYLNPALRWADGRGFVLPLSFAVVVDSYLHSGKMLDFLMKRFPERKPDAGGDEKAWIKAYIRTRHEWLLSKGKPLSNTVYRMQFFSGLMVRDNWEFDLPMVANGRSLA